MTETTQATVYVEAVNQPAPGKKMGSVKTKELGTVWAWPNQLDHMQAGNAYRIKYKVNDNFKSIAEVMGAVVEKAKPVEAPEQSNAVPVVDPLPERIFVCGVVNSAVSSGKDPTVANLIGIVNAARQAWAETFGKK